MILHMDCCLIVMMWRKLFPSWREAISAISISYATILDCTHVQKVVLVIRKWEIRLDCSAKIQADLEQLRDDYILNDKSQMLVMISMATDEMIRLVAMYPDVWFMNTTAGMYDAILCCALVFSHGFKWIHLKYVFICYITTYISGNHICMLFMLQIGVVPLYCTSSYGGWIHLLYKLIYYPNSYMHVVQAPTIKKGIICDGYRLS